MLPLFVNPNNLKNSGVNKKKFIKALSEWKRCYMKKPKSWQKVWFWWEYDKNSPNEQWFMNIAKSTRSGIDESFWIIAKNLDMWIDQMEREGYKYYISDE